MKSFKDLNYYEMLEISVNASDFEIRQAYKDTLSIYSEESAVTYSLFSDEERKQILDIIECAFTTLIDRKARVDYDRMLLDSGQIDEEDLVKPDSQKLVSIFGGSGSGGSGIFRRKIEEKAESEDVKAVADDILSREHITGNDLRTLRKAMGIDLQDVYEVTRISVSVLQSMEDDDIENLPSGSYLKNFLKIYAEFLKIDSARIVESYLKNVDASPV
jgi:DnaJ-class molecular chaperone